MVYFLVLEHSIQFLFNFSNVLDHFIKLIKYFMVYRL